MLTISLSRTSPRNGKSAQGECQNDLGPNSSRKLLENRFLVRLLADLRDRPITWQSSLKLVDAEEDNLRSVLTNAAVSLKS
jgi:hypothetical protein